MFNLADDPYEKTDLAESQPQRVAELRQKLAQFQQDDLKAVSEDLWEFKN